jgi:hypothetical protein
METREVEEEVEQQQKQQQQKPLTVALPSPLEQNHHRQFRLFSHVSDLEVSEVEDQKGVVVVIDKVDIVDDVDVVVDDDVNHVMMVVVSVSVSVMVY